METSMYDTCPIVRAAVAAAREVLRQTGGDRHIAYWTAHAVLATDGEIAPVDLEQVMRDATRGQS
jgi:hypothetical protein